MLLKWIKHISIKPDIMNLIEKKFLGMLELTGTGKDFLNITPITQAVRLAKGTS